MSPRPTSPDLLQTVVHQRCQRRASIVVTSNRVVQDYRGIQRWSRRKRLKRSIVMTPGKRKGLDASSAVDRLREQLETVNAGIRAGYLKARYRGLA